MQTKHFLLLLIHKLAKYPVAFMEEYVTGNTIYSSSQTVQTVTVVLVDAVIKWIECNVVIGCEMNYMISIFFSTWAQKGLNAGSSESSW